MDVLTVDRSLVHVCTRSSKHYFRLGPEARAAVIRVQNENVRVLVWGRGTLNGISGLRGGGPFSQPILL